MSTHTHTLLNIEIIIVKMFLFQNIFPTRRHHMKNAWRMVDVSVREDMPKIIYINFSNNYGHHVKAKITQEKIVYDEVFIFHY